MKTYNGKQCTVIHSHEGCSWIRLPEGNQIVVNDYSLIDTLTFKDLHPGDKFKMVGHKYIYTKIAQTPFMDRKCINNPLLNEDFKIVEFGSDESTEVVRV